MKFSRAGLIRQRIRALLWDASYMLSAAMTKP